MSSLVISGIGFVGSAVMSALSHEYTVHISDPKINDNKVFDFDNAKGVILCLPTPQKDDGSCDLSYIDEVLSECYDNIPILIKSTMSLDGFRKLREKYSLLSLTFSPEFLTAKNAKTDFKNQKTMYFAGDKSTYWASIFEKAMPNIHTKIYDSIDTLILAKYFRNSFLALKVSYANQMFDACEKLHISFDDLIDIFVDDDRIGNSHTKVPGDDGRGFGGACFPKDTSALLHTMNRYQIDLSILKAAVSYNNKIKEN